MAVLSALLAALPLVSAGVVILPGGEPKPFSFSSAQPSFAKTPSELLSQSLVREFTATALGAIRGKTQVLYSSFDSHGPYTTPLFSGNGSNPSITTGGVLPSADSFLRGALQAWGEHLHLEIRPDEVWFSVLAQLSLYMLRNAEALRPLFVDHEGKQLIYVEDLTWPDVLAAFSGAIQQRLKRDWLRDWIRPGFSTSQPADEVTASVLMMGLMQAYFRFEGGIVCGLPSVSLLGTQADWESLLAKLDHLKDFGAEPAAYAERLRPIFKRFAGISFTAPDSPETRSFWRSIVSARAENFCGAPPFWLTGWLVGFAMWDESGRLLQPLSSGEHTRPRGQGYILDNVTYPELDIRRVPFVGYATAPFVMRDFGGESRFSARVAAGGLAKAVRPGPPEGYASALARSGAGNGTAIRSRPPEDAAHWTLRPLSGWALIGPVVPPENLTDITDQAYSNLDRELDLLPASVKKWNSVASCHNPFVAA